MLATEGRCWCWPGAGTGKTRVITYRIAHLARAARAGQRDSRGHIHQQSRQRDEGPHQRTAAHRAGRTPPTCGSPHSILFARACCAAKPRISGLPRDFAIYDDDDQTAAVKRALLQLDLPTEDFPPRSAPLADQPREKSRHHAGGNARRRRPGARRNAPASRPKSSALTTKFCAKRPRSISTICCCAPSSCCASIAEVRAAWSSRFQYLMVDEFQDTNASQEELVRLLAGTRKNVCVVGDEDQSIYGWRGARAGNLKRFTEDFPGREDHSPRRKLPLDADHSRRRRRRGGQQFRPPGQESSGQHRRGQAPRAFSKRRIPSPKPNSSAARFRAFLRNDPDAHVAVLYRTGSQSRSFEEILRRMGIRYRVVGGFSFYERAEVRNALAYVRLLFHPEDDVALLRVLNVPPRGIGAATVALLDARAKETNQSLWDVIRAGEFGTGKRLTGALNAFREMIEGLQQRLPGSAARAVDRTRARPNRLSRLGRAAGQHRAHFARRKPARTFQRHGRSHRAGPDAGRHARPRRARERRGRISTRRFPSR